MVLMQSWPAVQYTLCRLSSINHNTKRQSRNFRIFSCRNHTNTWKTPVEHTQSIHRKSQNVWRTVKMSIQSFCKNPFDIKSRNAGSSIKLLNLTKHPTCCQQMVTFMRKHLLPIKLRGEKSVLSNTAPSGGSSAEENSGDFTQDTYKYQHQPTLVI